MENKNKLLFLTLGVVIGIVITLVGVYLFDTETSNSKKEIVDVDHIKEERDGSKEAEMVKLTDDEIKELSIVLAEVGSQKLQQHIDLTGEIVPDPDKLAHIVPRFTGIVIKVNKKIGDRVKKNEIIAIIESNESLVTYEVKSSIDGVVLELHMTPGELIGDDKHAVTIADLSVVWAELNVYQRDLTKIKTGQSAEIYFDNIDNAVKGNIFYLSPTVDEHTRTVTARVKLYNARGYWKPGMFISSRILTEFVNVEQAVTLNSIQNFEEKKVIFVKEGDGFIPTPITIGKTNSKYAEILTGLKNGQTYISQGAFIIKSELLKESFGSDHGH